MIVFDLQCGQMGHVFEGWFSSSNDFEEQCRKSLIACPFCNDSKVSKAVMAPHVGAKGNQLASPKPSMHVASNLTGDSPVAQMRELYSKMATLQAETIKDSKWVGNDFERQARAMDSGEIDHGLIHGKATPDQAREMIEDGIGVLPLLIPIVPPDELN
jgi:hypothetical protein